MHPCSQPLHALLAQPALNIRNLSRTFASVNGLRAAELPAPAGVVDADHPTGDNR
jgi:hypothetical protein